jgi:prepilin-type N-terminal cleavage/methylation domain-containing protein
MSGIAGRRGGAEAGFNLIARRRGEAEAGFNLIEVIVALALLAVVMLSISGLFAQGSNSIKAGKEMTEALAQATDILEDANSMSYRQLFAAFGASGTDISFTADTRTNSFASRWQAQIEEVLWQGYATIDLTPLGVDTLIEGCSSTNFQCGQGIRFEVTLHWEERGQAQELPLATMRF